MLKYGVNLQKMLYFLSLFKKISAHQRFYSLVLNIGNRLFSGTVLESPGQSRISYLCPGRVPKICLA